MKHSRIIVMAAVACFAAACTETDSKDVVVQAGTTVDTAAADTAAQNAVQSFYDWYTLSAVDPTRRHGINWWKAMKPEYLSPGLIAALQDDSTRRTIDNDREALNGDPILDSQDPCAPYKVAVSRRVGPKAIVRVAPCRGDARIDVEVTEVGGRLVISDFAYPGTPSVRELICKHATNGDAGKRESACRWLKQP